MNATVELDELKSAWQSLDRRLPLENALRLQDVRERKLHNTRGSLRPLFRGQVLQILFGIPFIALAALLWSIGPRHASTIVAGVLVHGYGVIAIICAGVVLSQLRKIDCAAPVLDIQKQLARTRTLCVRSGMIAGLPWWFLWVPIQRVLAGLGGIDLLANAPGMVWGGHAVGALGLIATWRFHRWARQPQRAAFGRRLDASLTGGSLRKAQAQLEEVRRFEAE